MSFHYLISRTIGPAVLAGLSFAGAVALAQGEASQDAPQTPPPVVKVTCGWDGFTILTDANCTQTQQRRVLTCTDGTQKVGQCIG